MRCYNGTSDGQLEANGDRLWKRLKELSPEAFCTRHQPTGRDQNHGWQVHEWGKPITGYLPTMEGALEAGIKILEESTTQSSKEN